MNKDTDTQEPEQEPEPELIYYVDENDKPTGETAEKLEAHNADTKMHAAFSVYVFNEHGELLVTKRADSKKVWPSTWSNSCCGHPGPNETRESAITRRLGEELRMTVRNITLVVPEYSYKAPAYKGIVEHEYCPIYVAQAVSSVTPNEMEVSDYFWLDWDMYVDGLEQDAKGAGDEPQWTWWCKDQLQHLQASEAYKNFTDALVS